MKKIFSKYLNSDDGTVAVEFALVAMGFLTIVIAILEIGRLFMTWNTFQYSLETSTRQMMVQEDLTDDELNDLIDENLASVLLDPDKATVDFSFTEYSGVNVLEMEGNYDFTPLVATMLPASWSTISLDAQSKLPMPY